MARDSTRLDVPLEPRRSLPRPHYDPEAFGRFSETIARFIGTARFLVIQTVVVAVWVVWNIVVPDELRFDEYPFIFLTLALSLQAAYAAPLILLAQNRQADRDRVRIEEDRGQYQRMLDDTDYLSRELAAMRHAIGEVATRDFLRGEINRLVEETTDRGGRRRRTRHSPDVDPTGAEDAVS
jgi:uncharacterized membrane protein